MPSFASLGKFFGRTASEGAAFAAGVAVAPALSPVVREIVNEANATYSSHPVSAGDAAAIVAENVELEPWGTQEAAYNGVNSERFAALLGEVLNAPGVAQLLVLWRRGEITDDDFTHGLRKAKLETRWDAPLEALKTDRLDPAVIATAIQRGIMNAPFPLPYDPNVPTGNITPFPTSSLDAAAEAEAAGIDTERLRIETALVGLPMALDRAAQAHFRGILTDSDYLRAVLEGNARGEWAQAELDVARQILTAHDYAELQLRGYLTRDQRLAGTDQHGMSEENSDLLFDVLGRGLALKAAFIAERRGGVFDGPTDAIPSWALWMLQRGNLRPEVYNLAWAARYTLPSAFVIRSLLKDGALTADQGESLLLQSGWPEDLAKLVATHYAAASGATPADRHVTAAQTTLIAGIRKAFLGGVLTEPAATTQLEQAGLSADSAAGTLTHWAQLKALEALPAPAA